MDIGNLMEMANQLREQISSAQGEAQNLRATGEAGAGMVQVTMNGTHEVLEVKIDPKLLQGDVKFLQDLVCAAMNQASAAVAVGLKDRMGSVAKNMGVDMAAFENMMPGAGKK